MRLDHRFPDEGDQRQGIAGGPHGDERVGADRAGGLGLIGRDERFRFLLADRESRVLEVGHHADHFPPPVVGTTELHALSDGLPVAGQVAGERLVHHDDSRADGPIDSREATPAEEAQAHRVEVARARPTDLHG